MEKPDKIELSKKRTQKYMWISGDKLIKVFSEIENLKKENQELKEQLNKLKK
jgi:hypothetical protein